MRLPAILSKSKSLGKPMQFSNGILFLMIWFLTQSALATHLGTIGQMYPIGEESALDMIMKTLHQKERNGELKRLQNEGVRRSMSSIKNMKPVDGIVTVIGRKHRFIDPTVIYTKALTLDDGRTVIPAGTKINPLEMIGLSTTLIFFDGRDPEQREAVRKLMMKGALKIKPILIAGSWLEITKAWKTQVFYDQNGLLSKRFGIRAVPSVIRQQGNRLLLEEIPAQELR